MKKIIGWVIFFVWPALGFASVPAWEIIPSESQLTFTATQNDAPVSGEFKHFSGEIAVDPQNLNDSHIKIVVDINSISTSYSDLTLTLNSPDWFNSKMFPQAVFVSDKILSTGDKTYAVKGTLTIRDKSIPITLTVVEDSNTGDKARIHGNTMLSRTAFSVGQGEWASTDEVKDNVIVNFIVSAVKQAK